MSYSRYKYISWKKVFTEITTIYIIIEMVETEIKNYIDKKCYDCCHFKKENMELYKFNLPNGIANNITDHALDKEDSCKNCRNWRLYQELIKCHLNHKWFLKTNVEDDIIGISVYEIPPYSYVRAFLKISKKSMK